MRILFTNHTLADRAGTELYVRDLALALRKRGHEVAAYSPELGAVADELKSAGIEVVDDVDRLAQPPDIVHGHHHLETMTALLRLPQTPAVYVCHGWVPWEEIPPRHPRILRYAAVDEPSRDAAIQQHGVPADRISVLPNFVDLDRFTPRPPLPAKPTRALVLSNYASEQTHLPFVREACARAGLALDVFGKGASQAVERPEDILQQYDLVFAKGRSALESVAVGCAVIVCDAFGVGPIITMQNALQLRSLKGDYKKLYAPLSADAVTQQIEKYNAADASAVSSLARAMIGLDAAVAQVLKLYQAARDEFSTAPQDSAAEARAAAAYLAWLSSQLKEQAHRHDAHHKQLLSLQAELQRERNSAAFRLRDRVLRVPVIGAWLHQRSVKSQR